MTRRYNAEEMSRNARWCESNASFLGFPDLFKQISEQLAQAAQTESQVIGLVEAMEAIAASWDSDGRIPLNEDEYSAGRRQVGERVAEEMREALSKFRGGDDEAV